MEKLVSIVIPTYNRAKTVVRAVKSVLAQTYQNYKIIVVDDASTDNTQEALSHITDKRFSYIRHPYNKNGSAARNTGIRAAEGEYLALLDSDDEWENNKLARQVAVLETLAENIWGGTYCGFKYITPQFSRDVIPVLKGDLTLALFQKQLDIGASSTLFFRRKIFDSVGLFDESFERHQDLEFLVRFFRKFQLYTIQEPLVRVYGPNMPKGDKSAKIKEKFLNTFKTDIEKFGQKTANEVYSKHWEEVAKAYAREANGSSFVRYVRKANEFFPIPFNRRKELFIIYAKSLLKKWLFFGIKRS